MPVLEAWIWVAFAVGALIIGFSKTSFGGLGSVAAALFALGMPAKESTAAVLLLLIVGDAIALCFYGRHVQWRLLLRLVPSVVPGLLAGALFMRFVDDAVMRRAIGAILLAMLGLQLWQARRRPDAVVAEHPHLTFTVATGAAAGFTTMTANAAGPVMALYLLARRFEKSKFLSTNAWFFALINLCKVPLTASLGLFSAPLLWLDLLLVPAVAAGAALGRFVIGRVTQRQFETVTMVATGIAALALLVR